MLSTRKQDAKEMPKAPSTIMPSRPPTFSLIRLRAAGSSPPIGRFIVVVDVDVVVGGGGGGLLSCVPALSTAIDVHAAFSPPRS